MHSLLLEERKYLRDLIRLPLHLEPIVLVGSWARDAYLPGLSDIDVLVISDADPPPPPPGVQVLRLSIHDLRRRLGEGDDFVQWALRFGTPLRGKELWGRIRRELLSDAPWPDAQAKMQQAARRYRVAKELLELGDIDAAENETRFALSHLARGILLNHEVFPLSRPELPEQLRELGDIELADALESLQSLDSQRPDVRRLLQLAASRLEAQGRG